MDRKKFLKLSTLGLGSLPIFSFAPPGQKPLAIATWNAGKQVNDAAWKVLSSKGKSLDAVETGARYMESQQDCCVGLGGYPDRDGVVTLDACIMDHLFNCGAVAGLERIKHPISVARKIMETTPHVLLVGKGAQSFAVQNGYPLEREELSNDAMKAYKEWLIESKYSPVINIENQQPPQLPKKNGPFAPAFFEDGSPNHDTMGLLALDAGGNLAGAVTTSGMAFKMHGRVGDSAIIGGGLFVDNEVGSATSTGVGEEVVRICGSHLVVEFMRQGFSPEQACKKAVERIVKSDPAKARKIQVGFLAMNKKGAYGAYAIQKGFIYAVKNNAVSTTFAAKHLL